MEEMDFHEMTQLTQDGTRKFINSSLDWIAEGDFRCRDGSRWSLDSKKLHLAGDATKVSDYYMLNTTDSVYS